MWTVLGIIAIFCTLCVFPLATILGLAGVWIFGFWGAVVGVVVGLAVEGANT